MDILKLRPTTQLIGGIQTPCYGIFCGGLLLREVSVFDFDKTRLQVNKFNDVIEAQCRRLIGGANNTDSIDRGEQFITKRRESDQQHYSHKTTDF